MAPEMKSIYISPCERYCIFTYKNGLFGVLIKKGTKIVTVKRQYHQFKDAKECAELSLRAQDIVRELEEEKLAQMSLF